MQKFLVLYLCPTSVIEGWAKTDPQTKKELEAKMQDEWKKWTQKNKSMIKETAGAGKTKRITSKGVTDTKNEIMLYSIVEAPSHEEAAKIFEDHPHLQIPESSIEVMPANVLPGMK
ncbi:MAG TPA: hypothetical protein VJG67_00045 [Candidatus Paceibacterota bacterium]